MSPRPPTPLDYARKVNRTSRMDPTEIVVIVGILLFLAVIVMDLLVRF